MYFSPKNTFASPFLEFFFFFEDVTLKKKQLTKVGNTIMRLTCHSMEQKAFFIFSPLNVISDACRKKKKKKKCSILFLITFLSLGQYVTSLSLKIIRFLQRHSFQWLRRQSIDNSQSKQVTLQIKRNLRD